MRRSALLFLLLLLLPLAACRSAAQEEYYSVYFRAQEGEAALTEEPRSLPEGTDPVEGLLACLLEGPQGEDLSRTIPSGVTLRDAALDMGVLTVDFSGRYATLSGIDLTLADYSVVRTLSQLPEVETVVITVEGNPIPYRDHQRLSAGDAWFAGEE